MRTCNKCGFAFENQEEVCPRCGEPVTQNGERKNETSKKACPRCNTPLEDAVSFCPQCGMRLNSSNNFDEKANKIMQTK